MLPIFPFFHYFRCILKNDIRWTKTWNFVFFSFFQKVSHKKVGFTKFWHKINFCTKFPKLLCHSIYNDSCFFVVVFCGGRDFFFLDRTVFLTMVDVWLGPCNSIISELLKWIASLIDCTSKYIQQSSNFPAKHYHS